MPAERFPTVSTAPQERPATLLSPQEQELYELIVEHSPFTPINPREFSNLYKDVEKDVTEAERIDREIKARERTPEDKAKRMRGQLFEALVNTQIEESDWLGENAHVVVPSHIDDLINKIDSIVEFDQNPGRSHLALAFDITKSKRDVEEKFDDVRTSIDEDTLSTVKYFKSTGIEGRLTDVPRVIVGADQKTVAEAIDLLLRFKKHPSAQDMPGIRRRMENNPLQFQFLFEVKIQLEAFQKYARRYGKTKSADRYAEILAIIDAIIETKTKGKNKLRILSEIRNDEIFQMVVRETKSFAGEEEQ